MKIRTSFVSNSSTSSFVVVGVTLEGGRLQIIEQEYGIHDTGFLALWDDKKINPKDGICNQEDERVIIGYKLMNNKDFVPASVLEGAVEKATEIVEKYGFSKRDLKVILEVIESG